MKIEKLNDNQIRCTLNKHDLIDRELKISELAYGSEKAKGLFRDMMNQAFDEFGFEADDIPLIIEAIPVSGDCIILIVTKVEDPEELDTRFAKFSTFDDDSLDDDEDDEDDDVYEDDDEDLNRLIDNENLNHLIDDLDQLIEKDSQDSAPEEKATDTTLPNDILDLVKKLTEGLIDSSAEMNTHIVPISQRAKEELKKAVLERIAAAPEDSEYSETDSSDTTAGSDTAGSHTDHSDETQTGKDQRLDHTVGDDTPASNVSASHSQISDAEKSQKRTASRATRTVIPRVYAFNSLDEVMTLAGVIDSYFTGSSTLYKDSRTSTYYLAMKNSGTTEDFTRVLNFVSEYGRREKASYATLAYFDEHFDVIIKDKAISVLAGI